jgi:Immunity protein 7
MQGLINRPRGVDERLAELLQFLAARLPGAYGLLYEHDDERTEPPGPNAFRVRVLARGMVTERADPFLSPLRPVVAD